MSEEKNRFQQELDTLRTLRDEMKVQAELGRAELRDEFAGLKKRWHKLEGKLKVLADEAQEDLGEVRSAAGLLVDEIKEGYRKLKARI